MDFTGSDRGLAALASLRAGRSLILRFYLTWIFVVNVGSSQQKNGEPFMGFNCRILYMYIWDCFCFFESSSHPMCNFPCIIPQHWPQELPSLREHPGFSSSLAVELPVVDVVVASDGDKWAGTSLKFRTIYF